MNKPPLGCGEVVAASSTVISMRDGEGTGRDLLDDMFTTGVQRKGQTAAAWLEEFLEDGPRWRAEVIKAGHVLGFSETALKMAAAELKVSSETVGGRIDGRPTRQAKWSLDGPRTSRSDKSVRNRRTHPTGPTCPTGEVSKPTSPTESAGQPKSVKSVKSDGHGKSRPTYEPTGQTGANRTPPDALAVLGERCSTNGPRADDGRPLPCAECGHTPHRFTCSLRETA